MQNKRNWRELQSIVSLNYAHYRIEKRLFDINNMFESKFQYILSFLNMQMASFSRQVSIQCRIIVFIAEKIAEN